jgi:hypothetical protein
MPPRKYEGDKAERRHQAYLAWKAKDPKLVLTNAKARKKVMGLKSPAYVLFTGAQRRAERRKQTFTITLQEVEHLLSPMICSQTGHALCLEWEGPHANPWAPSLDRINSAIGYDSGNVQVVCWIYNQCKSAWTDEIVRQFRAP